MPVKKISEGFKKQHIHITVSLDTQKIHHKGLGYLGKGKVFNMSLKNQTNDIYPWDYQIGDDNFQLEPWILEKGKEFVSIEKNIDYKGFFYLQKNKEIRLSLNSLQIKSTYNQLMNFGYKLRISEL